MERFLFFTIQRYLLVAKLFDSCGAMLWTMLRQLPKFQRLSMKKIRKCSDMTLLSYAYAGIGNVLKVKNLLGHCSQHLDKGETHQGPIVLGIAMVAMAKELGVKMEIRLEHLLQYGEQNIRQAVPLALGHVRVDVAKLGLGLHMSALRGTFVKRTGVGTCKTKDSDAQDCIEGSMEPGTLGDGQNGSKEPREMLSGDYLTKGFFRLVQGTRMPHLTFLTRVELYPWLYVGLNVRICGSERDVVLTPLLPFSGSDDGPDATSPFYIDAIKTMCEHDKVLHVDCFYRFLHCCHMSNVPGVRIRIVEFYVWWTLPMPSYYHFVIPCLSSFSYVSPFGVVKVLGTT
ncbi:hypothetical protein JHK82_012237 [Glycine max]|nr:hypothetical protein JHK85_012572 [Glycine max]KAG5057243.1 hypothetical protein JHK86_012239 [Glycine max]KAG5154268.1 hypothetical protein JHK82_012237 [Glycine max]